MTEASATVASALPKWLDILGKAAPITSIALYMAPIPTILNFSKRKQVGDLPLLPYTSMLSNSFIWVVYGLLNSRPNLWMSQGVGFVLNAFYFLSFARFAPPGAMSLPGTLDQHVQGIVVLVATILWFAKSKKSEPIGQVGFVVNLAMYASPLAAMKTVMQTKSSASIPLPLTLASLLSCISWVITGYFHMKDPYIYVSPFLGILFCLMQLSLKMVYGESKTSAALSQSI